MTSSHQNSHGKQDQRLRRATLKNEDVGRLMNAPDLGVVLTNPLSFRLSQTDSLSQVSVCAIFDSDISVQAVRGRSTDVVDAHVLSGARVMCQAFCV